MKSWRHRTLMKRFFTEGRFGEMMLFGGWMMLAGLVLAALVLLVPVALAVVLVVMLTRNAKP